MKKYLWVLLVFSPLCIGAQELQGGPELKGAPEELKKFLYPEDTIISISAKAQETAYSDESTVNLIVTTEESTLSESMKSNASLRDKIRRELIDKGIKNEKINNSKFSSSPQYGWFGKKPSSYKMVNRVAVVIANELHLQDIADLADKHDEIVLSDVSFKHSKKEEFDALVKEQALSKIMKKRAYYEKKLGIVLTPVKFHEAQANSEATEGAAIFEEVIVVGRRSDKSRNASDQRSYAPRKNNSFDEVKYYASITVDFKISQSQ